MRVLLVQNELATARNVMQVLKTSGGIVDHVETGEEALELVRHYDYDIVLLDLMLPDMDGYEVVRRMRASRIEAPVVMLSAVTPPQPRCARSASARTTSSPSRSTAPSWWRA